MRNISLWAKSHTWAARILIITWYIILNEIGICTGRWLNEINMVIPQVCVVVAIILFVCTWVLYPHKHYNVKKKIKRASYAQRKFYDVALLILTFAMIVYAGNNNVLPFIKTNTARASFIIPHMRDTSLLRHPLIQSFITRLKSEDVAKLHSKQRLRLVRDQLRAIKHDKTLLKTDKTILIILSIIIAIGLIFGLSALACNIACSGSEGLAWVVLIGGTFLIVFFLARLIRHISHPRVKQE